MTRPQQLIAVLTLVSLSIFLSMHFCDWDSGYEYTGTADYRGSEVRAIIPLSSQRGIVARSDESFAVDGLVGIALPILMFGSALFILATPPKAITEKTPLG